jgi:hypothetical protein
LDYAGNTKKDREKSEKQAAPKEKVEKVIVGEVIQKERGPGRKFKEIFFGGDAKQAARFVASDVLLPALRNLVVDMVTKGAQSLVYGDSAYRRRPPTVNYGARYQVGGPAAPSNPFTRVPELVGNQRFQPGTARVRQNRHEMNDVILGDKQEADLVIERLIDILEKYDVVSLADLNDLLGLETSHIDNKWGWTYLANAQVRQIRQGYLLELPPLEEI